MKKLIIILLLQPLLVFGQQEVVEENAKEVTSQQLMKEMKALNEQLDRVRRECIPRPDPTTPGRSVEEEGTGGRPFCGN